MTAIRSFFRFAALETPQHSGLIQRVLAIPNKRLISKNTASMEKRFFRREWSKAIEEAAAYPPEYPFIQPIILDDTPLDSPGIPRQFRDRHVRKLEALPQLIEDAKRRIRERRLQRRSA